MTAGNHTAHAGFNISCYSPFKNAWSVCILYRNEMTARTVHKYEGHNICERCHDNIYKTKVSRKLPV